MFYMYECDKCELVTEIDLPMMGDHPKTIKCVCGEQAHRVFGNTKVIIPEHFQAASDHNDANNPTNLSNLKTRMNHSRPSGKEKVYY